VHLDVFLFEIRRRFVQVVLPYIRDDYFTARIRKYLRLPEPRP